MFVFFTCVFPQLIRDVAVRIKKNPDNVKFKVRTARILYTLVVTDPSKADKLRQSLPPGRPYSIHVLVIY